MQGGNMKVVLVTFLTYVLQRHRAIVTLEFWLIKWQKLSNLLAEFLQNQQQFCSILQMQELVTNPSRCT